MRLGEAGFEFDKARVQSRILYIYSIYKTVSGHVINSITVANRIKFVNDFLDCECGAKKLFFGQINA